RHLLDGILGDEFVPDEAVYLPRAGCSEIVIEKVSPRQRGVIPDKSFKSRVLPCKNTVAVGSAVVEMSVCIDDCCPAGERGSCRVGGGKGGVVFYGPFNAPGEVQAAVAGQEALAQQAATPPRRRAA